MARLSPCGGHKDTKLLFHVYAGDSIYHVMLLWNDRFLFTFNSFAYSLMTFPQMPTNSASHRLHRDLDLTWPRQPTRGQFLTSKPGPNPHRMANMQRPWQINRAKTKPEIKKGNHEKTNHHSRGSFFSSPRFVFGTGTALADNLPP